MTSINWIIKCITFKLRLKKKLWAFLAILLLGIICSELDLTSLYCNVFRYNSGGKSSKTR